MVPYVVGYEVVVEVVGAATVFEVVLVDVVGVVAAVEPL